LAKYASFQNQPLSFLRRDNNLLSDYISSIPDNFPTKITTDKFLLMLSELLYMKSRTLRQGNLQKIDDEFLVYENPKTLG
jgi:hypothetical protein